MNEISIQIIKEIEKIHQEAEPNSLLYQYCGQFFSLLDEFFNHVCSSLPTEDKLKTLLWDKQKLELQFKLCDYLVKIYTMSRQ